MMGSLISADSVLCESGWSSAGDLKAALDAKWGVLGRKWLSISCATFLRSHLKPRRCSFFFCALLSLLGRAVRRAMVMVGELMSKKAVVLNLGRAGYVTLRVRPISLREPGIDIAGRIVLVWFHYASKRRMRSGKGQIDISCGMSSTQFSCEVVNMR